MASIKQMQRKDGSVFYEISVSRGYGKSPYTMRWDRPEGLAAKTVKARLQAVAFEFEQDCKNGKVKTRKERKAEEEEAARKKILEARNKMTFQRFCEEKFLPDLRLRCSEHTIYNYQLQLKKHIYPDIGAIEYHRCDRTADKRGTERRRSAGAHGGYFFTPAALKTAQEAAQRAGEDIPAFVSRAVTNQNQRDKVAMSLRVDTKKAPEESGT